MDLLATYLDTAAPDDINTRGDDQQHLQAKCDALLSADLSKRDARTRLMIAYHLIRQNPGAEAPQIAAAELLQKAGVSENMPATWQALHERFPKNREILRNLLGWLAHEERQPEAGKLIETFFEGVEMSLETLIVKAEFYNELQDYTRSDALFRDLIERDETNTLPRVIFGKSLFNRGDIQGAFEVLEPVRRKIKSPEGRRIIKATDRAIIAMETISPRSSIGQLTAPLALRNALSLFNTRQLPELSAEKFDTVVFGTGTLGAYQSDRDLLKLAGKLDAQETAIGSTKVKANAHVICENLSDAPNWQGYKSACADAGLMIHQFENFTSYPLTAPPQGAEMVADIFTLLPRATKRGVEILLEHFRSTNPKLLVLNSEEAILPFVLAALLAEVPRIIINLRADAPLSGTSEDTPQYQAIYHALIAIPGLRFTAPTRAHAEAYANWLNLSPAEIRVLREPVFDRAENLTREESLMWQSFEIATDNANRTLALYVGNESTAEAWFERISKALLRHARLRIMAICTPSLSRALKRLADEAGLGPRLLVIEEAGEIDSWLARADLFSTFGTDGQTRGHITQAQLLGLPALLPDTSANRDLIDDGATGLLLAKGGEESAFQASLTALLDPDSNYQPMRLLAKERARRRNGAEAVLAELWRLALEDGQQNRRAIPTPGTPALSIAAERRPLREGAVTEAYSVVAREPSSSRSSA